MEPGVALLELGPECIEKLLEPKREEQIKLSIDFEITRSARNHDDGLHNPCLEVNNDPNTISNNTVI